jgi:hypothetical protein
LSDTSSVRLDVGPSRPVKSVDATVPLPCADAAVASDKVDRK